MKTKKNNHYSKGKGKAGSEKAKDKSGRKPAHNLIDKLMFLLDSGKSKAYSFKQLLKNLSLRSMNEKAELAQLLEKLESEEKIKYSNGGYKTHFENGEVLEGRIDFVNPRYAYVIVEGRTEDIFVNSSNMEGAIDGDTVKVMIYPFGGKGRKQEGRVVEVVKHGRDEFVGKIDIQHKYAFVIPDNKKMHQDIFVKLADINGAQHKDKVVVKITEWPVGDRKPEGKIIQVLGKAGENDAEMNSIMAEYGLPVAFPKEVNEESEAISEVIPQDEIAKRKDFRKTTTFTIDPIDAKDFDDAISVKKLDNGLYEIGVHIADVTHYVVDGTTLEAEAFKRATSVYLVDRVVPMLPEKLSNGLCSLRPHEDKLTFSAVFEIDDNGKVHSQWFGRTVIHSDRRFTYEEAQELIEGGEGELKEEVLLLNRLAYALRKERFQKGSIAFETVEVKFKLDEKGVPLGIIPKVRKDAHKLVEDFMLLANKKVAEFVYKQKKAEETLTMVYRTHDDPDPEKLKTFSMFAKRFGHNFDPEEDHLPQNMNRLADEIEGKPEQNLLQSLAIRSMSKAKYTTTPDPHFGLAFDHYTHFTSPIRRYPDMMVHRLLQRYLDKQPTANKAEYEEKCKHSSDREKLAADAERASIKYKQVEFMRLVGGDKVFDGIVSGVTEWGVFVEMTETRCEGLVRMSEMTDDYYEFDPNNYRVVGRRYKKVITLGSEVKVRVKATDLDKRTIDLAFVNDELGR